MHVLATRSKDTGAVPSGKTIVRLTCTSTLLVLLALLVPCQGMPLPHVCSWHGGSNWRQARPAARHRRLLSCRPACTIVCVCVCVCVRTLRGGGDPCVCAACCASYGRASEGGECWGGASWWGRASVMDENDGEGDCWGGGDIVPVMWVQPLKPLGWPVAHREREHRRCRSDHEPCRESQS